MDRFKAIEYIEENSQSINQLQYNKHTKNSYELRMSNQKVFLLVKFNNGANGFEVYFQGSNNIDGVIEQFNNL